MQITPVTPNANVDPGTLFGNIIGLLLWIALFIGIGILIYGISQLAQAFQEKAPDAMQRGLIACIVGGVFIGMRIILALVGVI